jgi:hypothetical protein
MSLGGNNMKGEEKRGGEMKEKKEERGKKKKERGRKKRKQEVKG